MSNSDTRCQPDQLHQLLAGAYGWTNDLWAQAISLAWDGMTTPDAAQMLSFIDGSTAFDDQSSSPPTTASLEVFRMYPVAVFLGAYELMRHRRDLNLMLEEMSANL